MEVYKHLGVGMYEGMQTGMDVGSLPPIKPASAIWRRNTEGGTLLRDLTVWIRFSAITVNYTVLLIS